MVVAETFYRDLDGGKKQWINPADVVVERRQGPASSPPAESRRPAGGHRRHREDVEVEEQRRRPAGADRPVRRRHRAPLHDVRRAARPVSSSGRMPASKAPSASCKRVWNYGHDHFATATRAALPAGASSPPECAARQADVRREMHTHLKAGETTTSASTSSTPWCRRR
jgi:leucyl-tRNA synthetase